MELKHKPGVNPQARPLVLSAVLLINVDVLVIVFLFFMLAQGQPRSTLFPYTTLFRSSWQPRQEALELAPASLYAAQHPHARSEEHTSELQSRGHLVCRLLLEKKKDCYGHLEGQNQRSQSTPASCI